VESDFLKTDIGRSLEWGLWEDLFDSDVIQWHSLLSSYANPHSYTEGSGATYTGDYGWVVSSGTTSGSIALITAWRNTNPLQKPTLTWDKRRMFKCTIELPNNTDLEGYVVMGRGYGTSPREGFKIVDDTLYMIVCDGDTENTSSIQTFSAGDKFSLKAKHYPGDRAEFWVDGDYVGQLTANLPSGTSHADRLFYLYVTNTAAADKRVGEADEAWFLQLED